MSETASPTAAPSPPASIPWLGLGAVLLGTFISTLNSRLSSVGLADIRGALHAGFDEGAWITTAPAMAQVLVAPFALWCGSVFGPRRALFAAALAFAVLSALAPMAANLPEFLALQFAGGLASGFFVPLTLSFLLVNTPPKFWAYGVAIYALNLDLSLNISVSLEGWYVDTLSWRWIFWQNVPLALGMVACLHRSVRGERTGPNRPPTDIFGLLMGGVGLALVYAGLDQGNRLDWLNSGLVWGLLLSGAILLAGLLLHELTTQRPAIDLRVASRPPLPKLLLLIVFLRITITSTAFLVPQYLGAVRGYRALEFGQAFFWIAAPQLVLCPLAAVLLRRLDPRIIAITGLAFICVACLTVANGLTPLWGTDQFLGSELLQAIGQSFALSGIVFFSVLHLKPQDALTFGGALQTTRLLGGEIGTALVTTLARVRTQVASNLIGQHLQAGDGAVLQRLQAYAGATHAGSPGDPRAAATALLSNAVRTQAGTQGVIDVYFILAALTLVALFVLVASAPSPTGPASHLPLFAARKSRLSGA